MFDRRIVAGSVVFYNSKDSVIQNIFSYINQVDHLFIVDNSDKQNRNLFNKIQLIDGVTYISNEGNQGIANALNRAAETAIQAGYQFLLTMDDDSVAPAGMVDSMLQFITYEGIDKIGIVGAQSIPEQINESVSKVWSTITSGSLLNLKAYTVCGPFLEPLFIDWVDHEYCFRLITSEFYVYEINYLGLNHELGYTKQVRFLGRVIRKWPSHKAIRTYYKTRNSLYVLQLYGSVLPYKIKRFFYRTMFDDFINMLFFEDDKYQRLKFMARGVIDYKKKHLGRLIGE